MFVDKEKISEKLNEVIENTLSDIYSEYGVKFGDISPEQTLQWDEYISNFADLFEKLITQNIR